MKKAKPEYRPTPMRWIVGAGKYRHNFFEERRLVVRPVRLHAGHDVAGEALVTGQASGVWVSRSLWGAVMFLGQDYARPGTQTIFVTVQLLMTDRLVPKTNVARRRGHRAYYHHALLV